MINTTRRHAQLGMFALALSGLLLLAGCPVSVCKSGDITSPGCTCLPNDVRPECRPVTKVGTIQLDWTVNGQPASTACATAGAVSVRISIDGATPITEACATGTRSFPNLTEGPKNVVADLLDGSSLTLATFTQSVSVIANNTARVDVMFTTSGGGTGSVGFSWTVGAQPASTACPVSSQVQIQSTSGPVVTPIDQSFACSQGTAQIDNLPAGSYTFKATLLDGATNPVVDNLVVSVMGGQVATVSPIDFVVGGATGTASITWTLINSQISPGVDTPAACPLNGTVAATITGPTSASSSGPCGSVPLVVPSLAAGSYTFDLLLTDETNHPGQSAAAQVTADIVAGTTADIAVTIDCTFCNAL